MSTLTTRGLYRKAELSDAADIALAVPQLADDVDAKALLWAAGTTGAMPASAIDGRLYHDTTTDRLLYDQGTTWRKILYQVASGDYKADNPVDATGFKISGTSLAASHLSNGVTGSGAVVLAVSPALTSVPTAPTAAVDTNTTQLATTAYVVGQGYAKLASPALTGTPTAPTAAPGTNTTQVATTAFVQANGRHIEAGHADYASGDTGISFATAFASTPSIALGYDTRAGADSNNTVVSFRDPSTTGFTVTNPAGGNRIINWIAT